MDAGRRIFHLTVWLAAFSGTAVAAAGATPSPASQSTHHVTIEEPEAPSPDLTRAETLIQKHDFPNAEPLLKSVTEKEPTNYVAWFDLGFVENALGKTDGAIAAYRKSVEAKPDVFESNLNLGLQLAKSQSPEAEQYLGAATRLKPSSHVAEGQARAWLSLAHVIENREPEAALVAYERAATLQPKDPEAHLAAGLLLEKQNRFADAEQQYRQALTLDPQSGDAITGLANVYMRGRRFPDAEEALRKLVGIRPNDAAAHIQLGRVLAAEGKNQQAAAEMQTAAQLAPSDLSVQRDLADLYLLADRNEEAEAAYRTLLTAHPDDAELHHSLAQTLLRQKKFADAERECLAAVRLKPDLGPAYGDLAFAAGENRDYPLALKALDARAKLMPEIPLTYFLRASAYDHLNDVKQAVANYHSFLNLANGKYPEQEWQAKHRLIALEPKK